MIYSRFLYTEFEQPRDHDGEGGYTIFSTQQYLGIDKASEHLVGVLKFAVLWHGRPDTRLIFLIEEAIARGVMSPVLLLHVYKGVLTVVYSRHVKDFDHEVFTAVWANIGLKVQMDDWAVEFIDKCQVSNLFVGGWLFREYAPDILAKHDLGISRYAEEMFLFKDNWTDEAVLGSRLLDFNGEQPANEDVF